MGLEPKNTGVLPFSLEVYAKGFVSDLFESEKLDSAVTGDEIREAFDRDVEKVVEFLTWRWDDEKRRMVPIVDSARRVKISIENGRRIGLKDYHLKAQVIEVYDQVVSGGQDYYNGNVLAPGVEVDFHWSEIAGWGCVYVLERNNEQEAVYYQATRNYTVPDMLAPTFRVCDAKRDGFDLAANLSVPGALPGIVPMAV